MSESASFSSLTTLKVGGPIERVYECRSKDQLESALRDSRKAGLPWYPLGGGSNVLASEEAFACSVLLMRMTGLAFSEEDNDTVLCVAQAGTDWNDLVEEATTRGLWGVENLAGIPGLVGAAPIQNIGAYGAELSDTLSFVDVYDTDTEKEYRLTAPECQLSYRDGRFKREPNLLVLAVGLALRKHGTPQTTYKDIALKVSEGADVSSPGAVAKLVCEIRSRKFPSLKKFGTAGSFFKNPVIDSARFASLKEQYLELPGYAAGENTKVPLAWILDHVLSLRGFTLGHASLFEQQPLVLVTHEGATARDVEALASEVTKRVFDATGITIEREVRAIEARK